MKKCLFLALVAGAAASSPALAQMDSVLNYPSIDLSQGVYADRAEVVFSLGPPPPGDWRGRGNSSFSGMRYDFTPGPGSNQPVMINAFGFAVDQNGTGGAPQTPSSSFTLRLTFYPDPAVGPAVSATALPVADPAFRVSNDFTNFSTPGFITFFGGAAIAIPTPIALPNDHGFVTLEVFSIGTTDLNPEVGPTIRGLTLPTVGSSDGVRWADASRNGIFEAAEAFGTIANPRGMFLILQGDVPPPPAPTAIDLTPGGCVPDAGLVRNDTVAAGGINWYTFTTCGDANFAARQFLAIDSEGSGADLAAGVYSGTGALIGDIAFDNDSGSGSNFLITYGTGIGAAVGDGRQYDGRNGAVLAGTYYLAVGPGGATFGPAFSASGGAGPGGAARINITTNTNGTPIETAQPSVAPTLRAGQDLGQILCPGLGGTAFVLPRYEVDWTRFEVCREVADPEFLDIDMSGGDGIADVMAAITDTSGNILFVSDDTGSTNKPQFSFGNIGPRFYGANVNPFDGITAAVLPVGTYWLVASLYQLTGTNDRWSVHNNSASSLTYKADFYVSYCDCASACPPCAADFDQDGGVTGSDIEAFFTAFEAGEACGDVDEDGGVTGADIEFFFVAFEAGNPNC